MSLIASDATTTNRPTLAPEAMREDRIHALDGLRAGAMFLGIVLHAAIVHTAVLPFEGAAIDVNRHWSFDVLFKVIHGFRMQLFFLLAGFFGRLVYERMGAGGFAKQRLKRVGLPFVLAMVTVLPALGLLVAWQGNYLGQRFELPPGVQGGFPTAHLWFLEYLLVFYGGSLVVAPLGKIVPAGLVAKLDLVFDRVMGSLWRSALLGAMTGALMWNGPWWGEARVPAFNIKVYPDTAALYGIFFAVGWWMHRRRDCLESLKRFVAPGFIFALAALACAEKLREFETDLGHPNYLAFKAATLYCAGVYSWLMTFAAIGWFLRYAPEQRAWVRYLADASYWCYLMHLPLLVFLQTLAARWPIYSYVKFTLILVVTMAILMATYRWWVRYSWVGRMLNGVRVKSNAPG